MTKLSLFQLASNHDHERALSAAGQTWPRKGWRWWAAGRWGADPVVRHQTSTRGTCRFSPRHAAPEAGPALEWAGASAALAPGAVLLLTPAVWLAQPSREHRAAILCSHLQLCFAWSAFAKAMVEFGLPNEFLPTEVLFIHARALILASKEFLLM